MKHGLIAKLSLGLLGLLLVASMGLVACKSEEGFTALSEVPPYIPPEYYSCVEISAYEMAFTYWSPYSQRLREEGSPIPGEAYRGSTFILKNYLVTDYVLRDKANGFIWIDMIKCYPLNPDSIKNVKLGTMIDVVGINMGPELEDYGDYADGNLIFNDCVFLAAGSVKIPSDTTGQVLVPAY